MAQRSRGGGGGGGGRGAARSRNNGGWNGGGDSWDTPHYPWPAQSSTLTMQQEEAAAAAASSCAAAAAESVLDALAAVTLPPHKAVAAASRRDPLAHLGLGLSTVAPPAPAPAPTHAPVVVAPPPLAPPLAPPQLRMPTEATAAAEGLSGPELLMGHWVDSQGNSVHVHSTDAYDVRLVATLSRPLGGDIHLALKAVAHGGGWQCGHSLLDPVWTSDQKLHWVATDGRITVWVRPVDGAEEEEDQDAARPPALDSSSVAPTAGKGFSFTV